MAGGPIADGKLEENPMLLCAKQILTADSRHCITAFFYQRHPNSPNWEPLPVEKEEFTAGDGSGKVIWPSMR